MIYIKGYQELNNLLWENKEKKIMLYFGATWCGPCMQLKKKINDEKEKLKELLVIYIDCDESENEEILKDWNVKALPTQVFVFLNGDKVIKNDIIEGYDWIKLLMVYNKIIEKKND